MNTGSCPTSNVQLSVPYPINDQDRQWDYAPTTDG